MNKSMSLTLGESQGILSKVPEITLIFWITKILTTGMGEVFSDYLVKSINPIIAVALGGGGLVISLILQFKVREYISWVYWLVVVMVSIFGTMAADVLHVVIGIPYLVSTAFFTIVLAAIFIIWFYFEKTLDFHSIFTARREVFYWATILATFALGTASGDMTASTMHLGYLASGILFTIILALPALGYQFFGLNAVFSFWFVYIFTRPVGASFSDWLSKPHTLGGVGLGEGPVTLGLTIIIIVFVWMTSKQPKKVSQEG